MRIRCSLLALLLASPLLAQEVPVVETPVADAPAATPLETLLEAARDPASDFQSAYTAASEAGVSPENLLSARAAHYLNTGNWEGLFEIAPQLEASLDTLPYGPDDVFFMKSQARGLVYSLYAAQAFNEEDWARFEEMAKAAYWESPQWTEVLGINERVQSRRIEDYRSEHLSSLVVPMDMKLRNLDGSDVSLAELAEGKKALLLDFWASWCGPCIRLMPELQQKHATLAPQGVFVAGLNTDDENGLSLAANIKASHEMDMPWLVEDEAQTLSNLVIVQSIPHMLLLSPEGKILWSGHPMDPALAAALANIGVTLEHAGD